MRLFLAFLICATLGAADSGVADITKDAELAALIAKTPGAVVVDFHSESCGPCKELTKNLVAIVAEHPGAVTVLRVDVELLPDVASAHQVESLPTVILFKDGQPVDRIDGDVLPKDKLITWILRP